MIHKLGRTKVLVAALLLAICLVFQNSGSAFARAPGNDFEWHVKHGGSDATIGLNPYCGANYTGNVGSIWLSDSRSNVFGTPMSASGGGAGVTIRAKYSDMDTGVLVYIFGSVYGCHTGGSYNTAKNLRDDAGYLTNLSGTELHRGTSRVNDFSDPGAPLTARLQINRIPQSSWTTYTDPNDPNNTSKKSAVVTVKLYRCFSWSPLSYPNCATAWIPVRIILEGAPWTVDGQSKISTDQQNWKTGQDALKNIRPGQRLYWNHTLRNNSQYDMDVNIQANIDHQRGSAGRNWAYDTGLGDYVARHFSSISGKSGVTFLNENTSYDVTQDDVDKLVCESVAWNPLSGVDTVSWGHSQRACATVPYHYPPNNPDDPDDPNGGPDDPGRQPDGGVNIVVSHEGEDTVLPGEDVKFNYTIENQKGPTKTKPIEYHTYTFILPGGNDVPSNWQEMVTYGMNWNNVNCTNGGRDVYGRSHCAQDLNGVTGNINPQDSWTDSSLYNISGNWLGNPGDQICSYIAVDNNWSVKNGISSTSYAASNISCVRIGKRPQIQMNGSDSYAGKGFHSSAYSAISLNINRGSYGQYGLLTGSSAPITNFGSAGYTANASAQTNACKLAFANVGSLTASCSGMAGLGNAGIDHTIAATTTIPNGVNANSINSGSISINGLSNGYHRRSGSLTINGGSLGSGVRATIVVNGDVTIVGNIGGSSSESTSYSSLAQVPSLTIIATGNIKVNGSVTLINANLVSTGGKFISCAESSAGNGTDDDLGIHDGAMCKNKLKINGSVVSKQSPVLHRTFGSGNGNYINQWDNNTITATSEWFNYTPNVWLTPYLSGGSGTPDGYNTVNVTGLPVRY